MVFARDSGAGTKSSTSGDDDPTTLGVNETGSINFDVIPPGETQFTVQVPEGWSFSVPGIRRIRPAGIEPDEASFSPSLNRNGSLVAFASRATNLIGDQDTNGDADPSRGTDVFVFNLDTGEMERVSVDSNGVESTDSSGEPTISGDGRYVAFKSLGRLDPRDSISGQDIYLRDRVLGTTQLASVNASGESGNAYSVDPVISSDGSVVVFRVNATNLYPGFQNLEHQVYFFYDASPEDGFQGELEPIIKDGSPLQGDDDTRQAAISGDGNTVVFESRASNFVNGFSGPNVYIYNREKETLEVIASGYGQSPTVNADGRVAAFGALPRLYVYDRDSPSALETYVYSATSKAISDDGRFLAFGSYHPQLLADDNNDSDDIFVLDRQDGKIAGLRRQRRKRRHERLVGRLH